MSLVATAADTVVLGSGPDELVVSFSAQVFSYRCIETRPSRSTFVFGFGLEQGQKARGTNVGSLPLLLV